MSLNSNQLFFVCLFCFSTFVFYLLLLPAFDTLAKMERLLSYHASCYTIKLTSLLGSEMRVCVCLFIHIEDDKWSLDNTRTPATRGNKSGKMSDKMTDSSDQGWVPFRMFWKNVSLDTGFQNHTLFLYHMLLKLFGTTTKHFLAIITAQNFIDSQFSCWFKFDLLSNPCYWVKNNDKCILCCFILIHLYEVVPL